MVIVDTGFLLALANRNDSCHTQAIMVLANLHEPLITIWAVVTGLMDVLRSNFCVEIAIAIFF
ncbi:hypothetical protein [uncultured Nostoc sp.]|uniref:hypothetical protein n=1 Tax=uncultured Nostoc sp. TaxID=340711 RepID=UPI0035CAABD4